MTTTGLLLDDGCLLHETGNGHPESPARFRAVAAALEKSGLIKKTSPLGPRDATDEDIVRCHSRGYLETAVRDVRSGASELSTGDTSVCRDSLGVARGAAGGVLNAVDAVFEKSVENAFCAVRPPGHHATPSRGMGFCLFNSVAIAARYAQEKHGVERVAIIDWDVHHGNGTQDIFYEDPSVFFFSTHQHPWYPGTGLADETGRGKGEGSTLNVPVAAGGGMDEIGGAFREAFVPAMDRFNPDLVLLSAGFDSKLGDPLGHLRLTDPDFVELTKVVRDLAHKHAGGRLVSLLEGGYRLEGLADAVVAHVGALAEG